MNLNGIENSDQLLNIRNENDFCVLYSLAAFFHRNDVQEPTNPKNRLYLDFISKLDVTNVNFPCEISDVETLVSNNSNLDIKVHLLCMHKKEMYPIKLDIGKGSKEVHLLIVDVGKKDKDSEKCAYNGFGHSVLILSIDDFLRKTYPKNELRTGTYKPKWGLNCRSSFSKENYLKHLVNSFNKLALSHALGS